MWKSIALKRAWQLNCAKLVFKSPIIPVIPKYSNIWLRQYTSPPKPNNQIKIDKPTYQLTFTCKACQDRSAHLISKQAYQTGTVLVQCPKCKNRHLIADHLNVFGTGKKTLEDILKEVGNEKVKKGVIDLNKLGDLEWESKNEIEQIPPKEV